jgi:hypothetical protein
MLSHEKFEISYNSLLFFLLACGSKFRTELEAKSAEEFEAYGLPEAISLHTAHKFTHSVYYI